MPHIEVRPDLGPYAGQWDALLLGRNPPPLEFLSWFLDGLAGPDTRYVLAVDDGQLLGGIPLTLRRERLITRMELLSWWAANVDVVVDVARAQETMQLLRRWFTGHRNAQISFDGVREDSDLRATLPTANETSVPGAPFLVPTSSFDSYLSTRSPNFRSEVRRTIRRLEREGAVYSRLEPEQVDLGLASLRGFHSQRFGGRSAAAPHFEQLEKVAPEGARRGQLVFHVLTIRDRIIATTANIEFGGFLLGHLLGTAGPDERALRGAGTALLAKVVEYACENGFHSLDMGRDPSDYKARWTDEVRSVKTLSGSWGLLPPIERGADRSLKKVRSVRSSLSRKRRHPQTDGRAATE